MTEQCVRCNGTGEIDSGAPDPQGHFIQIPCECQTEQHEWHIEGRDVFIERWDDNGLETMTVEECETRLNEHETLKRATEALSAEDATQILGYIARNYGPGSYRAVLRAYADILGGKDETS